MTINTDGGSRGNPGPGACGVVIKDRHGHIVKEEGKFLGVCTNNEAEYRGLLLGLKLAAELSSDNLEVLMDSELVIKQLRGEYRVKEPRLSSFYHEAKELEKRFSSVSYISIPRERNKEADAIVNKILDNQ